MSVWGTAETSAITSRPHPAETDRANGFRSLYARHVGFVWANLRRLGVPPGELEDAVQEVFVTAHRRVATLRPDASVRGWLFGILRRIAFRHRRSDERRQRLQHALATTVAEPLDPERPFVARQAATLVEAFLAELESHKREVFVLAELEQMTAKEIGAILELNANTVSSRLRAARADFVRHFPKPGSSDGDDATEPATALQAARHPERPSSRSKARMLAAIVGRLSTEGPVSASLELVRRPLWVLGSFKKVMVGASFVGIVAGVSLQLRHERPRTSPPRMLVDVDPSFAREKQDAGATLEHSTFLASGALESPGDPRDRFDGEDRSTPPTKGLEPSRSTRASEDPTLPAISSLSAETELLRAIQNARERGEPSRVLELADQHSRRFPNGDLTSERRALQITAWCALGMDRQARTAAEQLYRDDPESLIARRIIEGCPNHERWRTWR